MRAMPELTRRRDPEAQHETWLIHYGDIQVDVIAERVGNPNQHGVVATGMRLLSGQPSEYSRGIARSFEQARGTFDIAWVSFLAKRTDGDFDAYRRDRAFHAWKQAIWATGPPAPDAGSGRPGRVLLRRRDRDR